MIWFFEKERARLRYEIRRAPEGQDYELVITYSDRPQHVECFSDQHALQACAHELQRKLLTAGWQEPTGR